MGVASACLTAVAIGTVTAGVASNVVAIPGAISTPRAADVALTVTDVPIIDVNRTVGPLTVIRQLTASYDIAPQEFFGSLLSRNQTVWNGPLAHGSTEVSWFDSIDVDRTDGLAATVNVLPPRFAAQGGVGNEVGNGGVGVETNVAVIGPEYRASLNVAPDGATYFAGVPLISTTAGGQIGLGPVSITGAASGGISTTTALCLGNAPLSCGSGVIARQSISAPLNANLSVPRPGGDVNILAVDIPNNVAVAVSKDHLSVTGTLGGTVKVGPVTLGRLVPLDIQIPRTSTMAVSQKTAPDNETGTNARPGTALRTRIADVKKAITNALHTKRQTTQDSTD